MSDTYENCDDYEYQQGVPIPRYIDEDYALPVPSNWFWEYEFDLLDA